MDIYILEDLQSTGPDHADMKKCVLKKEIYYSVGLIVLKW